MLQSPLPQPDVTGQGIPAGAHPPRPRLAVNIGITGHRASVLPPAVLDQLAAVLDDVFRNLRDAATTLHEQESAIFAAAPPLLRLHTPLATGADQLASTSACEAGYHVRALLPFAPDDYRKDFAAGQELEDFERHLDAADAIFALPCDRSDLVGAYVMVGKAVVAASDILVAIWDGRHGNGPGGTAHVVELALANSVPVIHVGVDREQGKVGAPRLLGGGDPLEPTVAPLAGADSYLRLLQDTLTPHTSIEREQIADFFTEREKRTNWRIEYSLLLALLGVKPLPSRPWRQSAIEHDIDDHWKQVHDLGLPGARVPLARAYGWANFLAIRYAQLFRSGHIANYVLSALAVILALLGIVLPGAKIVLVILELATIGLLYRNTSAGRKGEWHRRWLQYRYLAESLRPLIYLKRTGMISPPFRSDFINGPLHPEGGADWTRWYAAAIWREMDSPTGVMTTAGIRKVADDVVSEQIVPQSGYHRVNAQRMKALDHRLHEIGNLLMGAVIAACVLFLIGYVLMNNLVKSLTAPFIFLTAGFPAIGAAVFGMRGHGEHLLAASRSMKTVVALESNAARLKQITRLEVFAAELEKTAAIMLADLNEWTAAYRERSLEIPG